MLLEKSSEFIYNSSIGIHAVSPEGIILYANPFELEMLGYSEDEYIGHHTSEFQLDKETLKDMFKRLNKFQVLKNYPAKVQGKKSIIYVLYNSSVYQENNKFIHTRCYGCQIESYSYDIFKNHI
jgi:PAS domain S-box-containing protein